MLAILDYDAGNIESVRLALRHVGGTPEFVRDAAGVEKADRIVFPGVGSAGQCMRNFIVRKFDAALKQALAAKKPVLAICIGMQLLFDRSEEDGGVRALGILPGTVRRFVPPPGDTSTKVPHMGWNRTETLAQHPLLNPDMSAGDFYYVHSYYAAPGWRETMVETSGEDNAPQTDRTTGMVYGSTDYAGINFTAMVGAGSLFATQFHPEKSGETGLAILERFLRWDGVC
ncbi:MAG: imidazole glycerol phosphate synthase subunit HisH [Planctomycetes bacterium]|nr:imidazole glycerol phosphate synthase subunit HisH [Planctomycetota bacterium]